MDSDASIRTMKCHRRPVHQPGMAYLFRGLMLPQDWYLSRYSEMR
jgi:hypothetical protein